MTKIERILSLEEITETIRALCLPGITEGMISITPLNSSFRVIIPAPTGHTEQSHPDGRAAGKVERQTRMRQHAENCQKIKAALRAFGDGTGYNSMIV